MTNEQLKAKALTDLFNSQELQAKIKYVMIKHQIPFDASIEDDILQVTFENLAKYDTEKFVEAYQDNPKRILGLAVKIILWKGVYIDKRIPKGFNHTIAQQILHASTFKTLQHISATVEDSTEDFNIIQIGDNYNDEEITENEALLMAEEQDQIAMWQFVRSKLSVEETELLNVTLQPKYKLRGKQKRLYPSFLLKLKDIITTYKNLN